MSIDQFYTKKEKRGQLFFSEDEKIIIRVCPWLIPHLAPVTFPVPLLLGRHCSKTNDGAEYLGLKQLRLCCHFGLAGFIRCITR